MIPGGPRRRLSGMVVRPLRDPDPVLEAGQRGTVHAHVAVHPDVAGQRLAVALRDEFGDLVAVAEHVAAAHVQFVLRRAVSGCLGGRPGPAAPRGTGNSGPPRCSSRRACGSDPGPRRRRAGPATRTRSPPARNAADLLCCVSHSSRLVLYVSAFASGSVEPRPTTSTATSCGSRPPVPPERARLRRDRAPRRSWSASRLQQHRVRAERPAVRERQARMAVPLRGERGRDITLGMAGRGKHDRHRHHAPVAARRERRRPRRRSAGRRVR